MANIAIIGATGIVGLELVKLFEKSDLTVSNLYLFASDKSHKIKLKFRNEKIMVEKLTNAAFKGKDLVFFCTPDYISIKYIQNALDTGSYVIDMSSAFRNNSKSLLCIPEINQNLIQNYQLFSSPNCIASIMSLVLFPLNKSFNLKSVIGSTYQAVSGGGYNLLNLLLNDTKDALQGTKNKSSAFNVYLHNSKTNDDGYNLEEKKIMTELKKILLKPNISISITAVRVPTLRCHSIACHLVFEKPVDLDIATNALKSMHGVKIIEKEPFAMCNDASEKQDIFCSRLRIPPFSKFVLELWIVGDQLLKGAALNAYQIAEHLFQKKALK